MQNHPDKTVCIGAGIVALLVLVIGTFWSPGSQQYAAASVSPTMTITASSASITVGQPATITATFTPITGDILYGTEINMVAPSGAVSTVINTGYVKGSAPQSPLSYTFTPTTAGTYTFKPYISTFRSMAWQTTASAQWVTVVVTASQPPPPPQPTCTLSASPVSIQSGSSSTLTFNSLNAQSGSIDQGVGAVALSGTSVVSPTATTTYTGTFVGAGGTTTCSAMVAVVMPSTPPPPPPPPSITLTASPASVTSGNSTVLSWSAPTGASCTITGTNGQSFPATVGAGKVSFTSPGTTNWVAPAGVTSVTYLVVGGGGGGSGGGGGAGGFLTGTLPVTPGSSYTITVGAGGASNNPKTAAGSQGGNSVFGSITAIGGGGGGYNSANAPTGGGSGGGGAYGFSGAAGTSGQGHTGGGSYKLASFNFSSPGGGGGASANGSSGTSAGGNGYGGNGTASSISGSSVTYAGGGGGGTDARIGNSSAAGGSGGGGTGGFSAHTAGTANTGGGGGGGGYNGTSFQNGSAGGSGIVILSYAGTGASATTAPLTQNTTFTLTCGSAATSTTVLVTKPVPANFNSPIGMNLNGVSYYDSEVPFLNILKMDTQWYTQKPGTWDTNEEQYMNLDANGWPTSVNTGVAGQAVTFTQISTLMVNGLPTPYYPGGQYVVLYDGQGTITYGYDAVKNTTLSTPGRDVITVATPSASGILLTITATDPNKTGNYIRNIRVVAASNEAALASGQIFNPTFLSVLAPFRSLRFGGWMDVNGSTQSAWSDRPLPTDAFWGNQQKGIPAEVTIALSNAINADPWFSVPPMATNDYMTQFATLVHQQLNSNRNVYLEYGNEVWNTAPGFSGTWVQAQGEALWPTAKPEDAMLNYSAMRAAQMCDIWKGVWGPDSGRVICVMGAQAAWTYPATESLACPLWTAGAPCYKHGFSALAIAPYFAGYNVPDSWTTDADGGLAKLFTEINQGGLAPGGYPGGMIKQAVDMVTAHKPIAAQDNLDLIVYEGGQSFVDPSDPALTTLYETANRDPRMGTATLSYLQQMEAAGSDLFEYSSDISAESQWGSWGALESVYQTTSPKYSSILNFINANPCWWTGCSNP